MQARHTTLFTIVARARRFFAPSAAAEMWDTFRPPLLGDPNSSSAAVALGWLVMFFPTKALPLLEPGLVQGWVDEWVDIWGRLVHCPFWDSHWMYLVARCIKDDWKGEACKLLGCWAAAARCVSLVALMQAPARAIASQVGSTLPEKVSTVYKQPTHVSAHLLHSYRVQYTVPRVLRTARCGIPVAGVVRWERHLPQLYTHLLWAFSVPVGTATASVPTSQGAPQRANLLFGSKVDQVDDCSKSAAKIAVHLLKQRDPQQPQEQQQPGTPVAAAGPGTPKKARVGLTRMQSLGLGASAEGSGVDLNGILRTSAAGELPQVSEAPASSAVLAACDSLDSLVQLLEQYAHPSNGGQWSGDIAVFLTFSVHYFMKQLGRQCGLRGWRGEQRVVPEAARRFVRAALKLAARGQFSKSGSEWLGPSLETTPPAVAFSTSAHALTAHVYCSTHPQQPHPWHGLLLTTTYACLPLCFGSPQVWPLSAARRCATCPMCGQRRCCRWLCPASSPRWRPPPPCTSCPPPSPHSPCV
jgi:hypothetical protein